MFRRGNLLKPKTFALARESETKLAKKKTYSLLVKKCKRDLNVKTCVLGEMVLGFVSGIENYTRIGC